MLCHLRNGVRPHSGVPPQLCFGSATAKKPRGHLPQSNEGKWLADLDSNQDKQLQRLLCYRYTIRQWMDTECSNYADEASSLDTQIQHLLCSHDTIRHRRQDYITISASGLGRRWTGDA